MMKTTHDLTFFAATARGLNLLLIEELKSFGATHCQEKLGGVIFTGSLKMAYRACLWSRLANKILLPLSHFLAKNAEDLYQGTKAIDWSLQMEASNTLFINAVSVQSELNHTLFIAQKVKDAIVDYWREKKGIRPDVVKQEADIVLHAYVFRDEVSLALDLSGQSLHKRGYRLWGGNAPLKENLAAAILLRANWPQIAKNTGFLIDPLCGSGTFLIEAAMMASERAPQLRREYFGFLKWQQHDHEMWRSLREEAINAYQPNNIPTLIGYDKDSELIAIASQNIERAGFVGKIHVEKKALIDLKKPTKLTSGLVLTNPPYGERLGEEEALIPLYQLLGEKLKAEFLHDAAGVFTGNITLGKQMGLRCVKQYAFLNGDIDCQLLLFNIENHYFVDQSSSAENKRLIMQAKKKVTEHADLIMLKNRLIKKFKHAKKQAKNKSEYIIYDADLPQYAFLITMTEQGVNVLEYKAPKIIANEKVLARRYDLLAILPEVLNIKPEQIYFSITKHVK